MTADFRKSALSLAVVVAAALLCAATGCSKKDKNKSGGAKAADRSHMSIPEQEIIDPPPVLPTYTFASAEVERAHPEITAFLREFFETCLNGDYLGYRKLVSRFESPESKERFTAIYYALRNSRIDSIEPIAANDSGKPSAFRVLTSVEFADEAKLSLRKRNRQIAILVVSEEGKWRMKPAPASLQPHDPSSQPASGPANSAPAQEPLPDYPWDADGDS